MRRTLALVLATVLVTAAGLAALVLAFSSGDAGELEPLALPGEALADQCAAHRAPPPGFAYNSAPPVSGPHLPAAVLRDAAELSDDALLHALHAGNVVLAYPGARPPEAARAVQEQVAGAFSPDLAEAGQAVILARRADADGLVALAWRHRLVSSDATALAEFAEAHLGAATPAEDC